MADNLIDLYGEVVHETELAYKFDDGTQSVWLPKSQVEWDPDEKVMTVPAWLALEKELI
jgi:hypothetical protein